MLPASCLLQLIHGQKTYSKSSRGHPWSASSLGSRLWETQTPDTRQGNEAIIPNPAATNERERMSSWEESGRPPALARSWKPGRDSGPGPATRAGCVAWTRHVELTTTNLLAPPLTRAHMVTWAIWITLLGNSLPHQQKHASPLPYESKQCY